jgi:Tfp pilus assembly protein FimT
MNFNTLKNERGLTLVELIVTMGVSSVLVIILISGSLFIQKFLNQWRQQGSMTEDIVFVQQSLAESIERAKLISIWSDSLSITLTNGTATEYDWSKGLLLRNNVRLLQSHISVRELTITDNTLTAATDSAILTTNIGAGIHARFRINLVLRDERGLTDSLSFVVRNNYAYFKYKTKPTKSFLE